jgi:hypothetical protein
MITSTNVRPIPEYQYFGDDETLKGFYANLNRFPRLARRLHLIVEAYLQVKGTLNEADYPVRLARQSFVTYAGHAGKCRDIVALQESRRCDYFRARTILRTLLGPSIASRRIVHTTANAVRACLLDHANPDRAGWQQHIWDQQLECQGALADFEDCLHATSNFPHDLSRALQIAGEQDATRGEGQRAFSMAFEYLKDRQNLAEIPSEIPRELQVVELPEVHADLLPIEAVTDAQTLISLVADILKIYDEHRADVETLDAIHQRHERDLYVSEEPHRVGNIFSQAEASELPRLVWRLRSYHAYWNRVPSTLKTTLDQSQRTAGSIEIPPVKEVAQSNCLGAFEVLTAASSLAYKIESLIRNTAQGPIVLSAMISAQRRYDKIKEQSPPTADWSKVHTALAQVIERKRDRQLDNIPCTIAFTDEAVNDHEFADLERLGLGFYRRRAPHPDDRTVLLSGPSVVRLSVDRICELSQKSYVREIRGDCNWEKLCGSLARYMRDCEDKEPVNVWCDVETINPTLTMEEFTELKRLRVKLPKRLSDVRGFTKSDDVRLVSGQQRRVSTLTLSVNQIMLLSMLDFVVSISGAKAVPTS